jgi:AraC-like DNA-binding protein
MSYTERLVDSPLVRCTWEQRTAAAHAQRVVPDACVDLIWTGRRLLVAGTDTRARMVALAPGTTLFGVRLHPGAAGAVLGLPASEVRDAELDLADVRGHDAAEPLLALLRSGAEPEAILRLAVERWGAAGPDPLVRAAVEVLDRPHARVAGVADELGVSARQLQRRVVQAVGYGPKTLARVLRFRRLRSLASGPLVDLALDAGYSDQAHMTDEVTRLAGVSPVRFLKDQERPAP